MRLSQIFSLLVIFAVMNACAYRFQGSENPWREKSVENVYINIMTNNSLRAGEEVPFTSAFLKTFSRGNKLKVVNDSKQADIVVNATIESIASNVSSSTNVPTLTQDKLASQTISDMVIATEYAATATVSVQLTKGEASTNPKLPPILLVQNFSRVKIYPGNSQFGLPGSTSVLINDSQFQMALNEIAQGIAADAYDTMLEYF